MKKFFKTVLLALCVAVMTFALTACAKKPEKAYEDIMQAYKDAGHTVTEFPEEAFMYFKSIFGDEEDSLAVLKGFTVADSKSSLNGATVVLFDREPTAEEMDKLDGEKPENANYIGYNNRIWYMTSTEELFEIYDKNK